MLEALAQIRGDSTAMDQGQDQNQTVEASKMILKDVAPQ